MQTDKVWLIVLCICPILHIYVLYVAIMCMLGLWRSPNQDEADLFILNSSSYVAWNVHCTHWYPSVDDWCHISFFTTKHM